jgi:hypothetical protein
MEQPRNSVGPGKCATFGNKSGNKPPVDNTASGGDPMPALSDSGVISESILLALLALFLLASPFTIWWMQATPPWWFIYALWLGLIGLTALLARRLHRYDF